jgi:hypothetical protein
MIRALDSPQSFRVEYFHNLECASGTGKWRPAGGEQKPIAPQESSIRQPTGRWQQFQKTGPPVLWRDLGVLQSLTERKQGRTACGHNPVTTPAPKGDGFSGNAEITTSTLAPEGPVRAPDFKERIYDFDDSFSTHFKDFTLANSSCQQRPIFGCQRTTATANYICPHPGSDC